MTQADRVPIVAVAGGSGAGKTTLVAAVADALGDVRACVLEHDRYYLDRGHLTPLERRTVNYDHPDAFDTALLHQHLGELASGRCVDAPIYDYATHTRLPTTTQVVPGDLVFVEGILLLAEPRLQHRFDLRIFIEASAAVRLSRRVNRDVRERGRTPREVDDQFRTSVEPMHVQHVQPSSTSADVILSGEDALSSNVEIVVRRVTEVLQRLGPTGAR